LQAYRAQGYGYSWVTEANIKATADVLSREFSSLGFNRINLDSGWQDAELDKYGRSILNHTTFPGGIEHLSSYLSQRKLKLGVFYLPGIDARAVTNKSPVLNSKYTADQIVQCPNTQAQGCNRPIANAFGAGIALNYNHPGAQMYINSVVDSLYSWGVSYVKLDGIVPGSSVEPIEYYKYNTTADLRAWRKAINELYEQKWSQQGRERILIGASWKIPTTAGETMEQYVDSFRIEQGIEAYSETATTTFDRVIRNAKTAAVWTSADANRKWKGIRDLDSILISTMTMAESKSMVTIWAMVGSLFTLGDDLTKLPDERKALVKNAEVLKLASLASTNQARLDGFNPSNLGSVNQKMKSANTLVRRDNNLLQSLTVQACNELAERRRMVVELGCHQKLTDADKFSRSCMHAHMNDKTMRLLSISASGDGGPDPFSLQTWVLEGAQGDIYVAVVNAGQQNETDKPASVQLSLSKLKTLQSSPRIKQMTAMQYQVRDLWEQKDMKKVSFSASLDLKLEVHGSILLKFTPAQ